jgi:hypothetical protein
MVGLGSPRRCAGACRARRRGVREARGAPVHIVARGAAERFLSYVIRRACEAGSTRTAALCYGRIGPNHCCLRGTARIDGFRLLGGDGNPSIFAVSFFLCAWIALARPSAVGRVLEPPCPIVIGRSATPEKRLYSPVIKTFDACSVDFPHGGLDRRGATTPGGSGRQRGGALATWCRGRGGGLPLAVDASGEWWLRCGEGLPAREPADHAPPCDNDGDRGRHKRAAR